MDTSGTVAPRRRIFYPESDGKPMGETETHRQEITDAIEALKDYFRDHPDVYVGGNMFFYYEKGKPERSVCPDVFVVRGVPKRRRRIYQLWREGHAPCAVIEMTSRSTRREDEKTKLALYARLGVNEYFLFDPLAEYLEPPLQGYRLVGGIYTPIEPVNDGALLSQELGLRLLREGEGLRFVDAATSERLLKPAENAAARRAAEKRASAETEARRAAEAELARLRAEIARLRGAVGEQEGNLPS